MIQFCLISSLLIIRVHSTIIARVCHRDDGCVLFLLRRRRTRKTTRARKREDSFFIAEEKTITGRHMNINSHVQIDVRIN
jgi:hypothetical protein